MVIITWSAEPKSFSRFVYFHKSCDQSNLIKAVTCSSWYCIELWQTDAEWRVGHYLFNHNPYGHLSLPSLECLPPPPPLLDSVEMQLILLWPPYYLSVLSRWDTAIPSLLSLSKQASKQGQGCAGSNVHAERYWRMWRKTSLLFHADWCLKRWGGNHSLPESQNGV